ncbi:MAG: NAD-glutamate dehydrogenase, partial [Thalassospira sp.]|nr:NAD-glutamate dehydrogenase [Thalassospira sp.]
MTTTAVSNISWSTLSQYTGQNLEATFMALFAAAVPAEDHSAVDAAAFQRDAAALWDALNNWNEEKPYVNIATSNASGRSVLTLLNPDQPFLVSSILAELARHSLPVHLVVHPVLQIQRRASRISGIERFSGKTAVGDASSPVSVILIYIPELHDETTRTQLTERLHAVLADVRAATTDWLLMRTRLEQHIVELEKHAPPVDRREHEETTAFLKWLLADNFTFLGLREMSYRNAFAADMKVEIRPNSGLGILRDERAQVFDGIRDVSSLPMDIQLFLAQPRLLNFSKSSRIATVHRSVPMDVISLKIFDGQAQLIGELRLIGLFSSAAYTESPKNIPILRRKVESVLEKAGVDPKGHDGKALAHILQTYPRDELYQIGDEELSRITGAILQLQERQRVALFIRKDTFERYISALVFIPRDQLTPHVRRQIQDALEDAFKGVCKVANGTLNESLLARLHFVFAIDPANLPAYQHAALEARLAELAAGWGEGLRQCLIDAYGGAPAALLYSRYGNGFPLAYQDTIGLKTACADVAALAALYEDERIKLRLETAPDRGTGQYSIRVFSMDNALPLHQVLPILDNLGFFCTAEDTYEITASHHTTKAWLHDFTVYPRSGAALDIPALTPQLEVAFSAVWSGLAEDDALNSLVLTAGLTARQIVILRALGKYAKQAEFQQPYSVLVEALLLYPLIAKELVQLFHDRFDPSSDANRGGAATTERLRKQLREVSSLVHDQSLSYLLTVLLAIWRTNYFQENKAGQQKSYVSFKIDSSRVPDLPLPRPYAEVFVYAAYAEAIHLRGGKVARGGIRWSDRKEDFRREVLGLIKAQMVKNAVIVPVGSKGGFIVKRNVAALPREEQQAEVVRCYKTLMYGLLDITDNLVSGAVVPPVSVVRHDGDDPYLVVAADKGTATFSDIANGVSAEYGFWLGDAFASGGSAGYDHKKMAITARGAWETVKRHFREMGKNIQIEPFTVVGVGDMSGDVFGNGMLLSPQIRLLAAFNHKHIFIDPNPDVTVSFKERERLFNLPTSQWTDYNAAALSQGGAIFERSAKSLSLTPEIKALFALSADTITPNELMQHILRFDAELLWFGGIGTYVRAGTETDAHVGDKSNDALRIPAAQLRAKVIGEGANLGMTQLARIEAAQNGVRLNTDAIDNSAGVDCSDHEVNIKILMQQVMSGRGMTLPERDTLLASMTDDVAHLVLADNYRQSAALSVAEARGAALTQEYISLMHVLEASGQLNRAIEFLPADSVIQERSRNGQAPLTRPELAVLLAYAKMDIFEALLESKLPDEPRLEHDLKRYFPAVLQERYAAEILTHPLRREIIATHTANSVVNR